MTYKYSKSLSVALLFASSAFGAAINCEQECTEEKCKSPSQFALCKRSCKDTPSFANCKKATFTGVTTTDFTAAAAEKREKYIENALINNPTLAKFFDGPATPAVLEETIKEKEVVALKKLLEEFVSYGIFKPIAKLRQPIADAHADPKQKTQFENLTNINANLQVATKNCTTLMDKTLKAGMTIKDIRKEVTSKIVEHMRAGMMAYAEVARIISERPISSQEAKNIEAELNTALQGKTFINSHDAFGAIITKHAENRASVNTIIQSLLALYKKAPNASPDKKLYATYLVIMDAVLGQIRFVNATKAEIATSEKIKALQGKYKIPLEFSAITKKYTSSNHMISNAIVMYADLYHSKMDTLALDASEDAAHVPIQNTPVRSGSSSSLTPPPLPARVPSAAHTVPSAAHTVPSAAHTVPSTHTAPPPPLPPRP